MKIRRLGVCFLTAAFVCAVGAGPARAEDKEYYGAVVMMVDHTTGLLGVRLEDEDKNEVAKHSFKVDPDGVSVLDPANRTIEFSEVKTGDLVDIFAVVSDDGFETVDQIFDYGGGGVATYDDKAP